MSGGAMGLVWVAGLALGLSAAAGCSGGADARGADAGNVDGGAGAGGADARGADAGNVEGGAGAGGATTCDCGTDVDAATIPLTCACAAGLCTTFAADLAQLQTDPAQLGLPYYVLLGTCDDGYRTLSYEEATEQARRRTYDADGQLVYDHFTGYGPIALPKACGFTEQRSLGSATVGEDSSKNCSYCLIKSDDQPQGDGAGGASGAGAPYYPESRTQRCDPGLLQ